MTDAKATKIAWFYTAVKHSAELTQVHRAAYNDAGILVAVSPTPETLSDVNPDHLFNFVTQVLHGLANRAAIDAATFASASAEYAAVTAAEQTA